MTYHTKETEEILRTVEGGDALLDWLSTSPGAAYVFPNFKNAEIVSFHLRRKGPSELALRMRIFEKSATVKFILGDWVDARLAGFSHQNVIDGLSIRLAGERKIEIWELGVGCKPGLHEIELYPCFGANGTIRATLQEVRTQIFRNSASEN